MGGLHAVDTQEAVGLDGAMLLVATLPEGEGHIRLSRAEPYLTDVDRMELDPTA